MEALNYYLCRSQDNPQLLQGNLQALQDMELLKEIQNASNIGKADLPEQMYLNQLNALRHGSNNNHAAMQNMPNLPNNLSNLHQYLEFQNPLEAKSYYQEAYNLYLTNNLITAKINELLLEKSQILMRLALLDKAQTPIKYKLHQMNVPQSKKKRNRRSASQIDRHYRCPEQTCAKTYGSEGSLYQHIKIKHPSFNISAFISYKEKKSNSSKDDVNKENANLNQNPQREESYDKDALVSDNQTTTEEMSSPLTHINSAVGDVSTEVKQNNSSMMAIPH